MAETASIAAAHASFNRIRQVEPHVPHLMAPARDLAPNGISIRLALFAGLTIVLKRARYVESAASSAGDAH